jgi:O-antigen ligase
VAKPKQRSARQSTRPAPARGSDEGLALRLARGLLWALVVLAPLVVLPQAKDSFQLPKLMLCELLGLASLAALAWPRRAPEERTPVTIAAAVALLRQPVLAALLPLTLWASASLAWTAHPEHTRRALTDLWIGSACVVGWALAARRLRLERYLAALMVPASVLAALAVLQFHGLYRPFGFGGEGAARLEITSLAGNVGVLGSFLVLPLLWAQHRLRRGWRGRRVWLWGATAALCLYALAISQTLTAIVALVAGCAVYWLLTLPRRLLWRAAGAITLLTVLLTLAAPPLRQRAVQVAKAAKTGQWNRLLSYRLDGWLSAIEMARRHPLTGVGHGAYAAEFAPARLALVERGRPVNRTNPFAHFGNAHNDYLEVAAELGLPGLAALAWGVWILLRRLRVLPHAERALAGASAAALASLALAYFPFESALLGYQAALWLAWILRRDGSIFA